MAITQVSGQKVTGSGATIVLTGVTAGNTLILQTGYYRTNTTGVAETVPTDSTGDTWLVGRADIPQAFDSGPAHDLGASIFYLPNATAGTHTVTPEANTSHQQCLSEFSGLMTSASLDQSTSNKSNADTHTSLATGTTATTTQADELVVINHAIGARNGVSNITYTDPVSGFTTLYNQPNDATSVGVLQAYKVLATTGTQTATFNWVSGETFMGSQAVIATFKAAGAAANAPSVNEAVTTAESIAMNVKLMPSLNEAVTAAEAITMHMPISLRMEKLS